MGCTGSSNREDAFKCSPLSQSEIQQRIDAAPNNVDLVIADVSMRYAWLSQRGYYPDGKP
jgi:hypothetical protein